MRIVVADGRGLVREGIVAMLREELDVAVVGQADNGLESVRLAIEHAPDIVLVEIALPLLNGIEAARRILARCPHSRIVCMLSRDSPIQVRAIINAGVSGILLDSCNFGELLCALAAVYKHQAYLSPSIAHILVDEYRSLHNTDDLHETAFTQLTPREREILQLMSEGFPTTKIASRLHVSVKTVGTHREHVMRKLNLHSIAELTRYAIREGLSSLDAPCQASPAHDI